MITMNLMKPKVEKLRLPRHLRFDSREACAEAALVLWDAKTDEFNRVEMRHRRTRDEILRQIRSCEHRALSVQELYRNVYGGTSGLSCWWFFVVYVAATNSFIYYILSDHILPAEGRLLGPNEYSKTSIRLHGEPGSTKWFRWKVRQARRRA